jgi:FlaA1/EpsC-like NDP-sugar epimerase
VLDLAKALIRLSGLSPEDDVPIAFVGLRSGERLNGSLLGEDERATAPLPGLTSIEVAARIDPRSLDLVEQAALCLQAGELIRHLNVIFPTLDLRTTNARPTGAHRPEVWRGRPAVSGVAR